MDICVAAWVWFTAASCSVCSATRRNPIPCLIGWMVFPQQRGVGFSREERRESEGGGRRGRPWQIPLKPPQGLGRGGLQTALPCMALQALWWKVVYHNIFSRLHLSAAEVKWGGEPKYTLPLSLFVWFTLDNRSRERSVGRKLTYSYS